MLIHKKKKNPSHRRSVMNFKTSGYKICSLFLCKTTLHWDPDYASDKLLSNICKGASVMARTWYKIQRSLWKTKTWASPFFEPKGMQFFSLRRCKMNNKSLLQEEIAKLLAEIQKSHAQRVLNSLNSLSLMYGVPSLLYWPFRLNDLCGSKWK